MKEKGFLPRYKWSDRTVLLVADIVEKLVLSPEKGKRVGESGLEALQNLDSLDLHKETFGEAQELPFQEEKAVQWRKNCVRLFQQARRLDPYSMEDLLRVHRMLGTGVWADAGMFRITAAAWNEGKKLAYTAPASRWVPESVASLLTWAEKGKKGPVHPLLQAAVVGYGLEVVQPFHVGNHVMSLFWQLLLLGRWNPIFWELPVLSLLIQEHERYEEVLRSAVRKENAVGFVDWVLGCYQEAFGEEKHTEQVGVQVDESVQALLELLGERALSTKEMMEGLQLKHRPSFRDHYLMPALQLGLVEMTIPDKPNSCRQRYRRKSL